MQKSYVPPSRSVPVPSPPLLSFTLLLLLFLPPIPILRIAPTLHLWLGIFRSVQFGQVALLPLSLLLPPFESPHYLGSFSPFPDPEPPSEFSVPIFGWALFNPSPHALPTCLPQLVSLRPTPITTESYTPPLPPPFLPLSIPFFIHPSFSKSFLASPEIKILEPTDTSTPTNCADSVRTPFG